MEIKSELLDFSVLGVDSKSVTEAQEVIDQLESRIKNATSELLKLNPTDKSYDSKMADLQSRTNAYKAQLEQAKQDLASAILALKEKTLENSGSFLDKEHEKLKEIDSAIFDDLLEVRDLVISRSNATEAFEKKRSILSRYGYELNTSHGFRDSKTPWRKDYPTPWSNALRAYINRFLELGGDNCSRPGDGQDVLDWVAKR